MRIATIENTRRRLQLALGVRLPVYLIAGVFFVMLGLWCIRLLAVETRLAVEDGRFNYTKTCLWAFECGRFEAAAADVHGIEVIRYERGLWRSLEVQVQLPGGAHQLALPRADGERKAEIARHLRTALSKPRASFHHTEGLPAAGLLLGMVCIAGGLTMLSAIQWITLRADRGAGTLRLSRRLLVWPFAWRREMRLDELHTMHVFAHTLRTEKHMITSYSLCLQTAGQAADDAVSLTLLPMFTHESVTALAQALRAWMYPLPVKVLHHARGWPFR